MIAAHADEADAEHDAKRSRLSGGGGGAAASGNTDTPLVEDLRDKIALHNFIARSSLHSYNNKHVRNRVLKVVNGLVLRNHQLLPEQLWVKGNKVIDPENRFWDAHDSTDTGPEDLVIDAGGCIVAPGFIDLQLNGAFGVDFSNPAVTQSEVDFVAANLVRYGVTSFLPTVVSSQRTVYEAVLPVLQPRGNGLTDSGSEDDNDDDDDDDGSASRPKLPKTPQGAHNLGLHLEGPFLNKQQKGAHEVEALASPTKGIKSIMERYGSLDGVRLITLAPELEGALDAVKGIVAKGVAVSIGHTECTLQQAVDAIRCGSNLVTHLFNAMRSFHHRDPGIVGLLGSAEPTFFSVIPDGIHVHDYALSLALGARGEKIVAITDAMAAHGLPKGRHHLGKMSVDVLDDRAVLVGTETLAGSIVSMDTCVQHLKAKCALTAVRAIETATLHPAQVLQMAPQKGTLDFGADADFVFLDPETLEVKATFVAGFNMYRAPE